MKMMLKRMVVGIEDESGQDLIEYALVAAIVGLGVVTAVQSLAAQIGVALIGIADAITSAI